MQTQDFSKMKLPSGKLLMAANKRELEEAAEFNRQSERACIAAATACQEAAAYEAAQRASGMSEQAIKTDPKARLLRLAVHFAEAKVNALQAQDKSENMNIVG